MPEKSGPIDTEALARQILEACKAINAKLERDNRERQQWTTQLKNFPGAHTLIISAREGHS